MFRGMAFRLSNSCHQGFLGGEMKCDVTAKTLQHVIQHALFALGEACIIQFVDYPDQLLVL